MARAIHPYFPGLSLRRAPKAQPEAGPELDRAGGGGDSPQMVIRVDYFHIFAHSSIFRSDFMSLPDLMA